MRIKCNVNILLLLMLSIFLSHRVFSATKKEYVDIGSWDLSIGLGLGSRSNPVLGKTDIPLFIIPSFKYYGERFFIDDILAGYTVFDDGSHTMLNLVATISYDQFYFNSNNSGSFAINAISDGGSFAFPDSGGLGTVNDLTDDDDNVNTDDVATPEESIDVDQLSDRIISGLLGIEYEYVNDEVSLSLQVLKDVTNGHGGVEIRTAISHTWIEGRHYFDFSGGGIWQNQKWVDYYYGLRESDSAATTLRYQSNRGALSPFIRINWRYVLTRDWTLVANYQLKRFDSPIRDSPLVTDVLSSTVFVGSVYHF